MGGGGGWGGWERDIVVAGVAVAVRGVVRSEELERGDSIKVKG